MVEHYVDIVGVASSNLASPTTQTGFRLNYFKITHIPNVSWSSSNPFNLRPRAKTLFLLFLVLLLFGLGESLLIISDIGVTPWTVFAQGVAKIFDISIGLATFLISISILMLWIPLKQKVGIGTISNAVIIAFSIDFFVYILPQHNNLTVSFFEVVIGILLVGIGSGIYLITNLGPGTRDGLMKGLSENFNKPIYVIRLLIEVTVVFIGWLLGGTVGLGTIMFAILIGPIISVSLVIIDKFDKW